MLDSKFFFTLVGLIVAIFAICNINIKPNINEGFGSLNTSENNSCSQCRPDNSCPKCRPVGYSSKPTVNYYTEPKKYDSLSHAQMVSDNCDADDNNEDVNKRPEYMEVSDMETISDMTTLSPPEFNEDSIIYDRKIMIANRPSNLRRLGDMVRGDLHIPIPDCKFENKWFGLDVSTNDLNKGFLNTFATNEMSVCGPSNDLEII